MLFSKSLFLRLRQYMAAPRMAVVDQIRDGKFVGRFYTCDAQDPSAFQFRMGAGFAGTVTRMHPTSIEPVLIDASAPPLGFGLAVVGDPTTSGVRQMAAGDTALTDIYGVTVRSFPGQDPGSAGVFGASAIGAGTPPISGNFDVMRAGYILVPVVGAAKKFGALNVWIAATGGGHLQGGFESGSTGGSTFAITSTKSTFNGAPDANGIVEIALNV